MGNSSSVAEPRKTTVADLAIAHPGAVSVFNKYNIDYCCGGQGSFDEACVRRGLEPEKVREEIYASSFADSPPVLRPESWSSSFLIDYIIQVHHSYVKTATPEITQLLDKVCDVHGGDSPELLEIRDAFLDLSLELTNHMAKEESFLFPALKRLEAQQDTHHPLHGSVQAPIAAMEHEHDSAGTLLKAIRSMSNNYTPPEYACPTYTITFKRLLEFEQDLMRHIHLENNILFRRAKD